MTKILIVEDNEDMQHILSNLLHEEGYETIVVTKEGFSENDWVHNMVIRWLKRHKIHVLDVMYEIGNLEVAAASFCKRTNE